MLDLYLYYKKVHRTTIYNVYNRDYTTMIYDKLQEKIKEGIIHNHKKDANYDEKLESFMESFYNTWYKYNSLKHFSYNLDYQYYEKINNNSILYFALHKNPILILKYSNLEINYNFLSGNKYLHIKDVIQYKDRDWNWEKVFNNVIIDLDTLQKNKDSIKWDFYQMSKNHNITPKIVYEFQNENWNYDELSRHIDWNIVKLLPNKKWNYKYISLGKREYYTDFPSLHCEIQRCIKSNIGWEDIINNPEIQWDFSVLSDNPNISMEIILEHSTKNWDYDLVIQNINFDMKYKDKILHKVNDYYAEKYIIYHSTTRLVNWKNDLYENMDKDYKCYFMLLSYNPNLTSDFFINNDYDWDYDYILSNGLFRERILYIINKINKNKIFLEELKNKIKIIN